MRCLGYLRMGAVLAVAMSGLVSCSSESGYELTFMSDRGGRPELYSMELDASLDSVRITPLGLTEGDEYAPIWNRRGTELMFTSHASGVQNVWIWSTPRDTVFRLIPDTIQQATGSFSADGRSILLAVQDGDYTTNEIVRLDRNTGATVALTNNDLYDVTPRYSPDGSQMAFCRQHVEKTEEGERRNGDIFIMDLASREEMRLTFGDAFDCLPAWSPDGTRIAFHGCSPEGCFIHVIDVASGAVRTLAGDVEPGQWPRWSPDGSWIAYTATRGEQTDVMLVSSDGGKPRALTAYGGRDEVADWRPGRR